MVAVASARVVAGVAGMFTAGAMRPAKMSGTMVGAVTTSGATASFTAASTGIISGRTAGGARTATLIVDGAL